MTIELGRWRVPGRENFDRYNVDENWGEGAVLSHRDAPIAVYLRFYEWNLFGAVREGLHTQADRNQHVEATWDEDQQRGRIVYPDDGVSLDLEATATGVELTLTVVNRSSREWPRLAALVPCVSPGRESGRPKFERLADEDRQHTYFYGQSGLEPLTDREVHWHEDARELVAEQRPPDGFPWDDKWPTATRVLAEPLLIRESTDGNWSMGVAWEESLSAQGHNPWWCLHLSAVVGPLDTGERQTLDGKVYLMEGGKEHVRRAYRRDFD
jgi:hypothetical protein